MTCRYWILGAMVVGGALLLAGCRTVPGGEPADAKRQAKEAARQERADEKTLARVARAHAHYATAVVHEVDGDQAAAEEQYYQAALLDPEDETLVLEVSGRLLANKKADKALEIVRRAAAQPDASGELYARLGLAYAELGKADEAVAANRTAIKRSPDSLAGYQNLCATYLTQKRPDDALKVLGEAARRSRASADFVIGLAEIYTALGLQAPAQRAAANKQAEALLNRAVKLEPLTPLLRLKLADGFNLLGDSARAAEYYEQVLKDPPDLPLVQERVRGLLASIYLQDKDHKRASEQLEAILRDHPTNPQVYYYLGQMALEEKKPAAAAGHFNKALMLRPDLEAAYYYLALAQIEMGQIRDALVTLEKARQKFAANFTLEYFTGLAYVRQKGYPEAVRHFIAAEVIGKATAPEQLNEGFYFRLGAACERAGDYEQAERYFEQCLKLAPDSAEALNYLGYMWAERGVKLDRAREMIEKAVKLEPKSAAYLDSMAWVLFKQGHAKEALPYALKAVEHLEEPDATVYDHLGDIYAALKEPEKALEAWKKSLAVEANDEVKKKVERGAAR